MKRIFALGMLLCLLCIPAICVQAEEAEARDITGATTISGSGFSVFDFLKDGSVDGYRTSDPNCTIRLDNPEGIASLYLYFDLEFGAYTITDNQSGKTMTAGQHGILHEYVDLLAGFGEIPTSVTLSFSGGTVRLSEIYCFSQGRTPSFVQKWTAPLEGGADIVLFSTHSDDDQLFFAGLVPLYAGEKGCRVQVVLMTDHREGAFATNARTHEVLNGLWATGLTAYPVFGDFWDYRIDDLAGMYQYYANLGIRKEDIQDFVVEQLRRFQPLVAIGHDLNGEYGHGMHKIYAEMLTTGISLAADGEAFPESAAKYGTWQVSKTYLHLYEENQILLDYDQPLERFDGLTAFQASQKLGFPCHHSQQWTWFKQWLNGNNGEITSATQIDQYNPAHFGLYQTTVGPDVNKNDFLENIVTYAQQDANAAQAVDAQISQLDTITLEREADIQAARAAYDALTPAQKALVSGLEALEAAEALLQQLQAQQVADTQAAQQVMDQINALGEITLEKEGAVRAAQAAYDSLTDTQKALVTNTAVLEAAHARLGELYKVNAPVPDFVKPLLISLGVLLLAGLAVLAIPAFSRRRYKPKYGKRKR